MANTSSSGKSSSKAARSRVIEPVMALTFDDVLLKPGPSEVMPGQVDTTTRITKQISLNIPLLSSAMDTVTESALAIAMAQAGGCGVIHRNLDPDKQADEVAQVKKFESGIVINPVTIHPNASLKDALDLMAAHRISGIPVVEARQGRQAGRYSHQPRRALCLQHGPARVRADDEAADHGEGHLRPGRGQAAPAQASHREAAGGRRRAPLHRADHGQGHHQGAAEPERRQGRERPPAGRRRHDGRRRRLPPQRTADRRRRRSDRRRYRAWPFQVRARRRQSHQAPLQQDPGDRRQCRHRRGDARLDRRRRRRRQSRHRPRLDLHDADRRGRRRAAAHRHHGCGRRRL